MGKIITKAEALRLYRELGYFNALNKLIKEYDISKDSLARVKVMLYEHILSKVSEAKAEAAKLQNPIARMEAACRAGMIPRPHLAHDAFGADYKALCSALEPFDGWTVSLLETSVSLLATVHDPPTAGRRVNYLRDSFSDLWNVRAAEGKAFKNHPELFYGVILKR